MNKVLIVGASSGIGRALSKTLVSDGNYVWAIARRIKLLETLKDEMKSNKFYYSHCDISKKRQWNELVKLLTKKNFEPSVVIFNAAININDLKDDLNTTKSEEMFMTNFFGILYGVESLIKVIKSKCQFIAISSFSALRGIDIEGLGYSASKAALNVAFEALYHKYKNTNFTFKVVSFGPVRTGMNPFIKQPPFSLSKEEAIDDIKFAIKKRDICYNFPPFPFLMLKILKILPSNIYTWVISTLYNSYKSTRKP